MIQILIKYILEGLAVAIAAFYIPQRTMDFKEILLIALTAAAVFSILDTFSPSIGVSARQGAGFGIGLNQVGFGPGQSNPQLNCVCDLRSYSCGNKYEISSSSADLASYVKDKQVVETELNPAVVTIRKTK